MQAFKEKPDKPTADRYVESGRYYWNSGMFVWRCDTVLGELKQHLPAAHAGLHEVGQRLGHAAAADGAQRGLPDAPQDQHRLRRHGARRQARARPTSSPSRCPSNGSTSAPGPPWPRRSHIDDHDNAVDCKTCLFIDSDNNIIVSHDPEHLVATIGVSDMIIVHTKDITMVCPKTEAQRVKELVGKAKEKYGDEISIAAAAS